jgi:hypothetical protein
MDPSGLDVSQAAKYCERNNEFLGSMKIGDLLIIWETISFSKIAFCFMYLQGWESEVCKY